MWKTMRNEKINSKGVCYASTLSKKKKKSGPNRLKI